MTGTYLLLVSERPAVRAFFDSLRAVDARGLQIRPVPVDADSISEVRLPTVPGSVVMAIDVALDVEFSARICEAYRARMPGLPVLAVICCPHIVTPLQLRLLAKAGVSGLLDLESTATESLRVLHSMRRGSVVLHAALNEGEDAVMDGLLMSKTGLRLGKNGDDTRLRIVRLLATGMSDRQIGDMVNLSRHTVHHHVERLCRELGTRNRTELAAWAGRNGLYGRNPTLR
jgi:DNA-binding NarL/FixJ family response regulator